MNPLQRYGAVQAQTASRERLMVMLFEGALKQMRAAQAAFKEGRRADGVVACTKASDIVVELQATLDRKRAPELCDTLASVYQFTCARLLQASANADAGLAHEAERAFAPLVEAFAGAVEKVAAASR